MAFTLILCAVFWLIGWRLGTPPAQRWTLIGILLAAVIGITLLFPEGHGLRVALGGSPAPYLLLIGFAALVAAYRAVLVRLKARVRTDRPVAPSGSAPLFSETELNRYARHIVLREIGGPGQKRLKKARVLVIGVGGLGAPALQYLAAAGVGTIGVIDDDLVENANLQRQVIHTDARIGLPKVFSAETALTAQNPFVTVRPYHRRLTEEIAAELFAEYDIILDGTDNFDTRYLVNRHAAALGKPLISGALSQWEGQLSVFDPANGTPCYQCLFSAAPDPSLAPSCAEAGVFAPLPGVLGAMMAGEAVKLITGAGTPLRGTLLIYDALYGESRQVAVKPRAGCPICQAGKETST